MGTNGLPNSGSNGSTHTTVDLESSSPQFEKDEGTRREDPDNDDDLEDERHGHKHFDRDRGEADEGDLTEIVAPAPVDRVRTRGHSLEHEENTGRRNDSHVKDTHSADPGGGEEALTELAAPAPVQRRGTPRDEEKGGAPELPALDSSDDQDIKSIVPAKLLTRSRLATELYIHSYLIFFSILGTLARLGIEAITSYPNATVNSPVLWANLGGSLFVGLLSEDRRLFREEWGTDAEDWTFKTLEASAEEEVEEERERERREEDEGDEEEREGEEYEEKITQAYAAHGKVKKTIPLFIGLTVGFCGSFTSFSSFMRDAFLAATNQLPYLLPDRAYIADAMPPRNGGYSFEATIAVLIVHVAVSLGGLQVGANIALALDPFMPTLPFKLVRRALDPLMAVVGCGSWLGAIFLCIWPPQEFWRERVTLAIAFAPLGCLLRFFVSKHLNSRLPMFPLGTFVVNVFGTAVLGMCYDLQHSGVAARGVGCQVFEGLMEGFCGCLTTVSTWTVELDTLQRKHAWLYGLASVSIALGFLICIMGSLEWTKGFMQPVC